MLIGEVSRRTGVTASALRYYEREGLLPSPVRCAKRRVYDPHIIARIRILQVAREAGFSIAETRAFISTPADDSAPSARWQAMADRKVLELDALIARAAHMKRLLKSSFKCACATIEECEAAIIPRRGAPRRKAAENR